MDITGSILVSGNELHRFDNQENNGISLIIKDTDDISQKKEDNIYIEDDPNIIGVFISKNNIPLFQKIMEVIDEYEPIFETQDIKAQFIPDRELLELASMHPCNAPFPLIGIDKNNKEEI